MILILALVSVACSPATDTLDQLVADQERFVGDQVAVTGRVASFEKPDGSDSYVLVDSRQNRVLLLPDNSVAGHVGERVEVIGRFDFDPELGRILWVEEIRPEEAGSG